MNSLKKLSGQGPAETARLFWRKFIYRRIVMRRVGALAGRHLPMPEPTQFELKILGPDHYREVLGRTPHLTGADLDNFDRQRSACIVAMDGERFAASTWMTSGSVHVSELHREIPVNAGQHFSTRTYVDPEYRGTSLMSHMIFHYASSLPAEDVVWGLSYERNLASLRSVERIGWEWTGNLWTTFALGRRWAGEQDLPPLPAAAPANLRNLSK